MNQPRHTVTATAAAITCALLASLGAAPAHALVLGQADRFEGSDTEGWTSGSANPTPPRLESSGGPAGNGDGYLLLQSSGQGGAGGKLVAFGGPQWAGDYLAAGITGLRMDLNNLGATSLSLRLSLADSRGGNALSIDPVLLAAGSGWTSVLFPLRPLALQGSPGSTLGAVTQVRFFHATSASLPGQDIAATLGVDNVSAVPEPASAQLLVLGAAALAAGGQWRHRRRRALDTVAALR